MSEPQATLDSLVASWSQGGAPDLSQLFTQLYEELRRIARHNLQARLRNGPLQPTELLNEVYLRLASAAALRVEDRAHFLALACRAMRLVIVDTVRASQREKRGGGLLFVTLGAVQSPAQTCDPSAFLDLDAALERLFAIDSGQGRIVELHYFAGLSYAEISAELALSEATVHRHLRMAKAWLAQELSNS